MLYPILRAVISIPLTIGAKNGSAISPIKTPMDPVFFAFRLLARALGEYPSLSATSLIFFLVS